jgi:hypothetical protein
VGVEGRVVDLGQRQTLRDDRLPKLLVRIHSDVSGIKQRGSGIRGIARPTLRRSQQRLQDVVEPAHAS